MPDVWQGNFPSDDILDTTYLHPSLVPTSECKVSLSSDNWVDLCTLMPFLYDITALPQQLQQHQQQQKQDDSIGQPFNIKHHIHVELDIDGVGFKGLPQEWQDKLQITEKKRRTMKIIEQPDSLFIEEEQNKPKTKRESRQLHLSTSRKSSIKAPNVLKAVQVIQDQEKGEYWLCLGSSSGSILTKGSF